MQRGEQLSKGYIFKGEKMILLPSGQYILSSLNGEEIFLSPKAYNTSQKKYVYIQAQRGGS